MPMRPDILKDVLRAIKSDYGFKDKGEWLRQGKCPSCGKKELYARADAPWVLRCGRIGKCGAELHVKDLYSEIFDNWSKRYRATETEPNAAADAYLEHARGLELNGIRDWYRQEYYKDNDRNIGTATVRFDLLGGGWWERLIDQPGRFDRKARFAWGKSYQGHWWQPLDTDFASLAACDSIWIVEGIFDALALRQAGVPAVSIMSCYNYPEHSLTALRKAIAELGGENRGPSLVWALDIGAAGTEYTRKFVKRATEAGWVCSAAQVNLEEDGGKLDWNDCLQRGRLDAEHRDKYLWNGNVLIAPDPTEKALLFYQRNHWNNFPFVYEARTFWAHFNANRIAEVQLKEGLSPAAAARVCADINEIANCAVRALYYQRDEATDDSHYYLRVDFPSGRPPARATFTGGAMAGAGDFKKRLLSVAPGAIFTGGTSQLDRLMQRQLPHIKTVEAINFTGYSRSHGAYILGKHAVKNGRVFDLNPDDYFDLGDCAVKQRSTDRLLNIVYDADRLDTAWLSDFLTCFGTKGLVSLSFWFMALFAEQIREKCQSLGYLEIIGEHGTGKSTLIAFLWKLLGRSDYEGFDPAKATSAAIARNLVRVGNLPVVFMEADRGEDVPHSRRFDWEELKPLFNGRSVRARGVKSSGNETYEPPFRGALLIEQNDPVNASPAVLSRIMQLNFQKSGWSSATKLAADAIEAWPIDRLSGFILHAAKREKEILDTFFKCFANHEQEFVKQREIRDHRVRKCHAQLKAGIDALAVILPLTPAQILDGHEKVDAMALDRQLALNSDHPVVVNFWETFDWIYQSEVADNFGEVKNSINHSRKPDETIAVNLNHFEQAARSRSLNIPRIDELKRHLKTSKSRKYIEQATVNSNSGKYVHCWVFAAPKQGAR